jgi:hypothetical protein
MNIAKLAKKIAEKSGLPYDRTRALVAEIAWATGNNKEKTKEIMIRCAKVASKGKEDFGILVFKERKKLKPHGIFS